MKVAAKNIGPFVAFNPAWFQRHQRALLWLLRWRLFRWILRIECDREIIEIRPHCHTVALDEPGMYRTDFLTHWKYSKRIYFAFRPLWWTLHFWDWLIADRFVTRLSFGFNTLYVFPADASGGTTFDGYVARSVVGESWATIRAGAGNAALDSGSAAPVRCAAGTSPNWQVIVRIILLFDTSVLGSLVTIAQATLRMKQDVDFTIRDDNNMPADVNVYSSNPVSNSSVAVGDYQTCGTTPYSDPVFFTSVPADSFVPFVLNASGLAALNVTGISKFSLREATHDAGGATPGIVTNQESRLDFKLSDFTSNAGFSDPRLVVTYSLPGMAVLRDPRLRPRPFAPGLAR